MGVAEHWGVEQLAQEIALDKAKAPQWFAGLLFVTQQIFGSTNLIS